MNCYLCKSSQINLLYHVNKWSIYYCRKCSYVFVYPLLDSGQLKRIYQSFKHNIFEKSLIILHDATHSLRFINKYRNKKRKLLDVGCGNGIFLREASKNKWNVAGIDMSSKMVAYLRSNFNYKVFQGDILSTNIKDKYDIVTLNQVIEHFSKTRLLIKRCHSLLNKEGLIYIATPNILSTTSKIRKEKFDYIIPPEHLSYFNKRTLYDILTSEGFRILEFNTWSYPVDLAGIIKFFLKKKATKKINNKHTELKIKRFDIKRVKYFLFDQVFCHLFYRILNFNFGGTMIEVLAIKQ